MVWDGMGTLITDETTEIKIHNDDKTKSHHEKKHQTSNNFERDGDSIKLGGRKNLTMVIVGKLFDISGGSTADAQKKKLLEWNDSGTTVYMISSVENEDNNYSECTHEISGVYYIPMVILEIEPGEPSVSAMPITVKVEEVT